MVFCLLQDNTYFLVTLSSPTRYAVNFTVGKGIAINACDSLSLSLPSSRFPRRGPTSRTGALK